MQFSLKLFKLTKTQTQRNDFEANIMHLLLPIINQLVRYNEDKKT